MAEEDTYEYPEEYEKMQHIQHGCELFLDARMKEGFTTTHDCSEVTQETIDGKLFKMEVRYTEKKTYFKIVLTQDTPWPLVPHPPAPVDELVGALKNVIYLNLLDRHLEEPLSDCQIIGSGEKVKV